MQLTIRQKLVLYVFLPFVLLSLLLLSVNVFTIRRQVLTTIEDNLNQQARQYATNIDAALRAVANIARTKAHIMEIQSNWQDDQFYDILRDSVRSHPLVYGAALAFEPSLRPDGSLFSPYVHEVSHFTNAIETTQLDIATAYDYTGPASQWWHAPKFFGRGVWTEPYFDEGAGNILMSTFSVPFYRNDTFTGVTTVDIPLANLPTALGIDALDNERFFMLSAGGLYLFHENTDKIMNGSILEEASVDQRPDLRHLGEQMLADNVGVTQVNNEHGEVEWVAYAPIASAGWSLALRLPATAALAPVRSQMLRTTLSLLISSGALLGLGGLLVTRMTGRIRRLEHAADKLAHGNLLTITTQGNDELSRLATTLNNMAARLHAREARLRSENVRLADDVAIVQQIQRRLLPAGSELELDHLDIAVLMEPANEVGGDYYDVLEHEGHLKITIGDVTGHGLDSGLVMLMAQMGVRTLLEHRERDSRAFLTTLNRALYKNINRMRSHKDLTLLLLDYTPTTTGGHLQVSGQHETLLVFRQDGNIDTIDTLDLGFPLGLTADIGDFVNSIDVQLEPGDGVVLYSDGVTEATNIHGSLYGLESLQTIVQQYAHTPAAHISQHISDDLYRHVEGNDLDDDITLVVLKQR
jgi:serine phosphatase RsbU (regulator of sigma subunit)/heme exporter protein D